MSNLLNLTSFNITAEEAAAVATEIRSIRFPVVIRDGNIGSMLCKFYGERRNKACWDAQYDQLILEIRNEEKLSVSSNRWLRAQRIYLERKNSGDEGAAAVMTEERTKKLITVGVFMIVKRKKVEKIVEQKEAEGKMLEVYETVEV
jgi:hypothetical protein